MSPVPIDIDAYIAFRDALKRDFPDHIVHKSLFVKDGGLCFFVSNDNFKMAQMEIRVDRSYSVPLDYDSGCKYTLTVYHTLGDSSRVVFYGFDGLKVPQDIIHNILCLDNATEIEMAIFKL